MAATTRRPVSSVDIGSPLQLSATAATCNADPTTRETHVATITDSKQETVTPTTSLSPASTRSCFGLTPISTGLPPVQVSDGSVEGSNGNLVTIEIPDCGVKILSTVTLIDPCRGDL